ncbi:MAG TPA: hypothetical protein VGG95_06470 [Edaphobacter sp.]|jgi:hypothetical protein
MRNSTMTAAILTLTMISAVLPVSAEKIKGSATLKDTQTTGMKDKQHKHQAYDLLFDAQGKSYTCRTDSNKSMNATDFVVGAQIRYEVDGDKTKIWSSEGKKVDCRIVRVETAAAQ